jgi:nucleoid DNA-binding protein
LRDTWQVTKAQLIDQIADSTELNKQDCEKIVSSMFGAITKALQAGERIEIRGFGAPKVKDSPPSAQSSHW